MKTYKEYIYDLCTEADMNNPEEATRLAQMLATECMDEHNVAMRQEAKLKEVLSAKDYEEWSRATARELFKEHIENMEQSDFKDFVLENFEEITDIDAPIFALNIEIGDDDDEQ